MLRWDRGVWRYFARGQSSLGRGRRRQTGGEASTVQPGASGRPFFAGVVAASLRRKLEVTVSRTPMSADGGAPTRTDAGLVGGGIPGGGRGGVPPVAVRGAAPLSLSSALP